MMISRNAVSFMHSRLLYAKKGIQACFTRVLLPHPSNHLNSISRRDKPIHVNLSRSVNYSFGARGVCEGGGGGGGGGEGWLLQKFYDEGVRAEP